MARRKVIEVTCDRCKKTEVQAAEEVSKAGEPECMASMGGVDILFDDLCRKCRGTAQAAFDRLRRLPVADQEKQSAKEK